MSSPTPVQWATMSWGITLGCDKKSDGCKLCYAIKTAWRLGHNPNPKVGPLYEGLVKKTNGGNLNWTGVVRCVPERLEDPLHWKKPQIVFVTSQSDLFHEDVPFEFVDKALAVMAMTARHKYKVLTKRSERMLEYFTRDVKWDEVIANAALELFGDEASRFAANSVNNCLDEDLNVGWPLRNLHSGVSIEDPNSANERLPLLMLTPAAVRWVSYEPALKPVNFLKLPALYHPTPGHVGYEVYPFDGVFAIPDMERKVSRIDQVVIGGESGAGARTCQISTIRNTIAQGRMCGVPIFVKQMGRTVEITEQDAAYIKETDAHPRLFHKDGIWTWNPHDLHGGDIEEWPEDLRVREVPRFDREMNYAA